MIHKTGNRLRYDSLIIVPLKNYGPMIPPFQIPVHTFHLCWIISWGFESLENISVMIKATLSLEMASSVQIIYFGRLFYCTTDYKHPENSVYLSVIFWTLWQMWMIRVQFIILEYMYTHYCVKCQTEQMNLLFYIICFLYQKIF